MRDKDNMTPLHCACKRGSKDVVVYLVEEVKCDVGEITEGTKWSLLARVVIGGPGPKGPPPLQPQITTSADKLHMWLSHSCNN